jgi:hypothetical protein
MPIPRLDAHLHALSAHHYHTLAKDEQGQSLRPTTQSTFVQRLVEEEQGPNQSRFV